MSVARETDASVVKPLGDPVFVAAHIARYTTGAAVEAGEAVYLDSSGYIQPCNAGAVATNACIGVAVQDIASGARGDVVISGGRILCLTGATPGGLVFTTDTAGEMDHTGGTKKTVVGYAESATAMLVAPYIVSFS